MTPLHRGCESDVDSEKMLNIYKEHTLNVIFLMQIALNNILLYPLHNYSPLKTQKNRLTVLAQLCFMKPFLYGRRQDRYGISVLQMTTNIVCLS